MTTSNRQLIKNFLTGRHNNFTDKKANSMMIREKDGYTILEGYGHALYGLKKGGTVILFDDWYGYSSTTSSHLNRLRRMAKSDEHINLIEDEEISQPKSRRSDKVLDKIKCDFCNDRIATASTVHDKDLRVCGLNRCNQQLAKGGTGIKVNP